MAGDRGGGPGWAVSFPTGDQEPSAGYGAEHEPSFPLDLRCARAKCPPGATVLRTARSVAAPGPIVGRFRRRRAGDRGLIAAPWTPLAFLCFPFRFRRRPAQAQNTIRLAYCLLMTD